MVCPDCGNDTAVCETREEKPTYGASAYILPVVAIIIGALCIALFIYVNGSDDVYSSRKVTKAIIIGVVFPIWGVYRLWKLKTGTQKVTECTCSSCGAVYRQEWTDGEPVFRQIQKPKNDRVTNADQPTNADRPTDANQ